MENSMEDTLVQSPAVAISTTGFNYGTLRVYNTSGSFKDYNLETGESKIGRKESQCRVFIPDQGVSRVHCTVLIENGEHFIMDNDSRNKTYRNRRCIRPNVFYELTDGCELFMSTLRCVYYHGTSPEDTMNMELNESKEENVDDIYNAETDASTSCSPTESSKPFPMQNLPKITIPPQQSTPLKLDDSGSSTTCGDLSPSSPHQLKLGVPVSHVPSSPPSTCNAFSSGDVSPPLLQVHNPVDPTVPYDLYETEASPGALADKAESTEKPKKQPKDRTADQPIDDFGSKTATIPESPTAEEGAASPVDKQMTTSEARLGEELDERMETSKEASSPPPPQAAPAKQRKTAATKKKAGSSRGGRKQQTRKGGARKKTAGKDSSDDLNNIVSDESPDLNPQEDLEQVKEGDAHDIDKDLEQLKSDNVELATNEVCPSEELDERMETGKEVSPPQTAPAEQQKTVPVKKKAESSRGGRKQQTRRGRAIKAVSKDLVNSCENIVSDKSPDLNPQEDLEQVREGDAHDIDKDLRSDDVELATNEACPSEVDERMETGKEASPPPAKQRKTVPAKKKVEGSRGGRKQQTQKGRAKKKTAGKDLSDDHNNVVSDESPDLNPQEEERPVAAHAASNTPSPVLPSEPQVKNTPKRATKSKATTKRGKKNEGLDVQTESDKNSAKAPQPEPSEADIPRVMFTGVVDDAGAIAVKEMGGVLVQSAAECTHLVTDKVRRTIKFLCCLAQGCQIVSTKWLDESRAHGGFVSADKYLLKDRGAERQHNFSLSKSIESARTSPMLAGWKVHMTDSIKPPPLEMGEIIRSAGGEVLSTMPSSMSDNVFVVSTPDELTQCDPALSAGIPVCSTEIILGGILRQVLDTNSHQLENVNSKKRKTAPAGSAAKRRKR